MSEDNNNNKDNQERHHVVPLPSEYQSETNQLTETIARLQKESNDRMIRLEKVVAENTVLRKRYSDVATMIIQQTYDAMTIGIMMQREMAALSRPQQQQQSQQQNQEQQQ